MSVFCRDKCVMCRSYGDKNSYDYYLLLSDLKKKETKL